MTSNLLQRLGAIFGSPEQSRLRQAQREALVDLLVWTMYVDRRIAVQEQNQLQKEVGALPWENPLSVEVWVDDAIRRARDVLGREEAEARYLDSIAARLAEPEARAQAIEACERIARSDGALGAQETAHLERVKKALGDGGAA